MKGKIDEKGRLCIERRGGIKRQVCPYCDGSGESCGDWCPLFREPFKPLDDGRTAVKLCNCSEWWFDEFTDERG